MNYAYVYYFSDSSKLSEFIVSYESLKATHPKYPIYCMLGEACIYQKFVEFLASLGVGYLISFISFTEIVNNFKAKLKIKLKKVSSRQKKS